MKMLLCFIHHVLTFLLEKRILILRHIEHDSSNLLLLWILMQVKILKRIPKTFIDGFRWWFSSRPLKYYKNKLNVYNKLQHSDGCAGCISNYVRASCINAAKETLRREKLNLYIRKGASETMVYYFGEDPAVDPGNKVEPMEQVAEQSENLDRESTVQEQSSIEKEQSNEPTVSETSELESTVSVISQKRENEDTFEREKKRHKSSDSDIIDLTGSTDDEDNSLEAIGDKTGLYKEISSKKLLYKAKPSRDTTTIGQTNLIGSDSNIVHDHPKEIFRFPENIVQDNESKFRHSSSSSSSLNPTSLPNVQKVPKNYAIKTFPRARKKSAPSFATVPPSSVDDTYKYSTPDIVSHASEQSLRSVRNNEEESRSSKPEVDLKYFNKIWDFANIFYDSVGNRTENTEGHHSDTIVEFSTKHPEILEQDENDTVSSDDNVSGKVNITPEESEFYENISIKKPFDEREINSLLKNVVRKLEEITSERVEMNVTDVDENKYNESQFSEMTENKAGPSTVDCNVLSNELNLYSEIIEDFSQNLKIDIGQLSSDLHTDEKLVSPGGCSDRNTGRSLNTPESSVSLENYSGLNTRSPSPVKRTEDKTTGMFEIGESSKVLSYDSNYTPYPGLAAEPDKVKKDARYQKKFYKQKKALKSRDQKSRSKSYAQQVRKLKDMEKGPHTADLPPYSFVIPENYTAQSDFNPPNVHMPRDFFTPLDLTIPQDYASQIASLPAIDLGIIEAYVADNASSSNYFLENSPNASPIKRRPTESTDEQSAGGQDGYSSDSTAEISGEGLTDKNVRNEAGDELACYLQINFDSSYFESGKRMIYIRDQFIDHTNNSPDTVIPLKPMFGVEDVRYVYSDGDLSVEEFLLNLNNFENLYYEMKYFEDDSMSSFRALIRVVETPMKLPCEYDSDFELVGDELQIVRKRSLLDQLRSSNDSKKRK